MMALFNQSKDNQRISQVVEAKNIFQRTRGLMFRKDWDQETSLWIHNCNSIHTCFVRFPIDVVFVNKDLVAQKILTNLKAWRMILPIWSAQSVFEFKSEKNIDNFISEGDQLYVGD